MGVKENVGLHKFPKQKANVGKRTKVCFEYDFKNSIGGTVVRDDIEEPYEMIIQLDDGRFVRAVECQYSFPE